MCRRRARHQHAHAVCLAEEATSAQWPQPQAPGHTHFGVGHTHTDLSSAHELHLHPFSHWHCLAHEHCEISLAGCEQPHESVCGDCGSTTFLVEEHPQAIFSCVCEYIFVCLKCFLSSESSENTPRTLRDYTERPDRTAPDNGHGAPFIMCQIRQRSDPPHNAKRTQRVTVLRQRSFPGVLAQAKTTLGAKTPWRKPRRALCGGARGGARGGLRGGAFWVDRLVFSFYTRAPFPAPPPPRAPPRQKCSALTRLSRCLPRLPSGLIEEAALWLGQPGGPFWPNAGGAAPEAVKPPRPGSALAG